VMGTHSFSDQISCESQGELSGYSLGKLASLT
jgi:hypothetical protein